MQRLGELNNKVIIEQKTAPENKHVIWKDPVENKFKEFKESGWVESDKIAPAGGGSDFPYEYISTDDIITFIVDNDITDNYYTEKLGETTIADSIKEYYNNKYYPTLYNFNEKAQKYIDSISSDKAIFRVSINPPSTARLYIILDDNVFLNGKTFNKNDIVLDFTKSGGSAYPSGTYKIENITYIKY